MSAPLTAEQLGKYSPAMQRMLQLDPAGRKAAIKRLPHRVRLQLVYDFAGFWGRSDQVWRPSQEMWTAYLAGRGWGKTRVGAEAARFVAANPWLAGGRQPRHRGDRSNGDGAVLGIAGRTANDVNETMIYGPSGIMEVSPPWFRPRHIPSKKLLIWPNGARARLFSGDVPASFRGPNIGWLWCDELAHWAKLKASWRNVKLSLRHGKKPRGIITTTPLGVQTLIELIYKTRKGVPVTAAERPDLPSDGQYAFNPRTRVVLGSTYDNAGNLASDYLRDVVAEFEGDELAAQELHGAILFERKGAPWSRAGLVRCEPDEVPDIAFTVVAVDPTVSDGVDATTGEPCECGIIVAGMGTDGVLYFLADLSGTYSTEEWGDIVAKAAIEFDAYVAVEDNQGGELVERNVRLASPRADIEIRRVHATRDKGQRAGLVNRLWKVGKVVHVGNPRLWLRLEHQMTQFDPTSGKRQPTDRMDAAVWAALSAFGDGTDRKRIKALSDREALAAIAAHMGRRRMR